MVQNKPNHDAGQNHANVSRKLPAIFVPVPEKRQPAVGRREPALATRATKGMVQVADSSKAYSAGPGGRVGTAARRVQASERDEQRRRRTCSNPENS